MCVCTRTHDCRHVCLCFWSPETNIQCHPWRTQFTYFIIWQGVHVWWSEDNLKEEVFSLQLWNEAVPEIRLKLEDLAASLYLLSHLMDPQQVL